MSSRITKNCLQFLKYAKGVAHYSSQQPLLAHQLKSRSVLRLCGKDASDLLQGVITNDMGCMGKKDCHNSLYSLMLNVQGRVVYDLIIYKTEEDPLTFLIECDSEMIGDLAKDLKKYKIRKKVDISDVSDSHKPWVVFPSVKTDFNATNMPSVDLDIQPSITCAHDSDPRLKCLGHRMILHDNEKVSSLVKNVQETEDPDEYTMLRYKLGVGEGLKDFPPGDCFPLESNAVFLNGVCFSKGCYVGQELTARTHHTGVTRKRLMPLIVKSSTENIDLKGGSNITTESGKNAGKFRNAAKGYGLGLLRLREAKGKLFVNSDSKVEIESHRPSWWPDEIQLP